MNQPLYSLKNVKKLYKSEKEITHALDDVNFDIQKGEVVVILGPSGSGKSTLLNVLSGIDSVTSGHISYLGKELGKLTEDNLTEYRRNNLGFIFQSYNLVSNLTVYENVELGGHLTDHALNMDEILKVVELDMMKHKFPYQLSGGQMQRVAIARAVVKNPDVLFCDEPTGALDEKVGKQVLKLLQDINQKYGTTIIIVTHNPAIARMGNVVIKMNSGKVSEYITNQVVANAQEIGWA